MFGRLIFSLNFFLSLSILQLAAQPVGNGQANSLLDIKADTLIFNVLTYNDFEKQTEISEIKNLYKLSVWHFAPGISYDFMRNRYYLTVSTSGLVNHFVSKKQEHRRVSAIERKYKSKQLADELKVVNKLMSIQADYQDILLAKQVVQIEIDIFRIHQEQYTQNEIDTEQFLNSKRSIINSIKNYNSAVTGLYKEILNLSSICNSNISADISDLYFSLDFIEN